MKKVLKTAVVFLLILCMSSSYSMAAPSSNPDDNPGDYFPEIRRPNPGAVLLSTPGSSLGDTAFVTDNPDGTKTVDYGITNVINLQSITPMDVYSSVATVTNDTSDVWVLDAGKSMKAFLWIYITRSQYNTYANYQKILNEWMIFKFNMIGPDGVTHQVCPFATITDYAGSDGYHFPNQANMHVLPPVSLEGDYYAKATLPVSAIELKPGESMDIPWWFAMTYEASNPTKEMYMDMNFRLVFTQAQTYKVNYYADSVAPANLLDTVNGSATFAIGSQLTEADVEADLGAGWIDAKKPQTGYKGGIVQDDYYPEISVDIEQNVINVVYMPKDTYSVVYDLDGGAYDGSSTVATRTGVKWTDGDLLPEGAAFDALKMHRANYTFTGWKITDGGPEAEVTGSSAYGGLADDDETMSITLTAQWESNRLYDVTYDIDGPKPPEDTVYNLPASPQSYHAGSTVTVAGEPTTTSTEKDGELGVWTFDGWDSEDAYISGGSFTMPAGDVAVGGSWSFTPNEKYEVKYTVTGAAPADAGNVPGSELKQWGVEVAVAADMATSSNKKDGRLGTWTFDGWTTEDATVSGGKFTMPENDVEISGSWTFVENDSFDVSYSFAGMEQPPADSISNMPETTTCQEGSDVVVAGHPATSAASKGAVLGTWTFNGWESVDAVIAGAGDHFEMPGKDVSIVGSWSFTPNEEYEVKYGVNGAAPSDAGNPPVNQMKQWGAEVTVAADMTTSSNMKDGILGVWSFNGWTAAGLTVTDGKFIMPENDVEISGSWTFTADPYYDVVYEVAGGDSPDVSMISNMPDPMSSSHQIGSTVTVAGLPTTGATTNSAGKIGVWTFSGWTSADADVSGSFTMPGNDVKITGSWVFIPNGSFNVTYSLTGERPDEVTGMPNPATQIHQEGAIVAVAGNPETVSGTKDGRLGTWTFNGWESVDAVIAGAGDHFEMPGKDVSIVGRWSFTPNEEYEVKYRVNGAAPSDAGNPPAGESKQWGAEVTVAANPTTSSNTKDGVLGTWTFDGWSTAGATVTDGKFTMPKADVEISGSWSFRANDSYNVKYSVSGDIPSTVSGMPNPLTQSKQHGSTVTVAGNPTTTSNSRNGRLGTWTFDGWTSENESISGEGSQFIMPANDVNITGKWTFTENREYSVYYQVDWDGPATVTGMPDPLVRSHQWGSTVTVVGNPATTENMKDGRLGTWTFNGWRSDDVSISGAGSGFTMPEGNVAIHGSWTFTQRNEFQVFYTVSGDVPTSVSNMPGQLVQSYQEGVRVTVAANPTTTSASKNGVPGTWTFNGWKSTDVTISGAGSTFTMPGKNAGIHGSWTFTPDRTYTVTFDPRNGSAFTSAGGFLPGDHAVRPANNPTRIGYTFDGWFKDPAGTIPWNFAADTVTADITIYGHWTLMEVELSNDGSLTVMKQWSGRDPNRPDSASVQLYKNGEASGEAVKLSAGNGWTYTWEGLDSNATWMVDELAVPDNYEKSISSDIEGSYTITNTWNGIEAEGEYTSVSVEKLWSGDDPNRPSSVEVQLYMYGEEVGNAVTLNAGNNWAYTWSDLDASAEWTVDEPTVPSRYTKNVTTDPTGKYIITNTWNGPASGYGSSPSKTGDDSPLGLWILLAFMSLIVLLGAVHFRKGTGRRVQRP